MGMREDDGVRSQLMDLGQPVEATVDHHAPAAILHLERSMPVVPPGASFDEAARS
jgi:hypothetical protein